MRRERSPGIVKEYSKHIFQLEEEKLANEPGIERLAVYEKHKNVATLN